MCEDCPPDRCNFCEQPILLGQPFARVMTLIYDADHDALKSHWQDFHHDPGAVDRATRDGWTQVDILRGPGSQRRYCLWLSELREDRHSVRRAS